MAGRVANYVLGVLIFFAVVSVLLVPPSGYAVDYPVVDTDQEDCYDNSVEINPPDPGDPFYGQDAQFSEWHADYQDNGDGTVTDLVTGLMWQKNPGEKMSYDDAVAAGRYPRPGRVRGLATSDHQRALLAHRFQWC